MKNTDRKFTCQTCNSPEMELDDLGKHLEEIHNDQYPHKGTSQMISHVDGSDWYGSVYRWEFVDGTVIVIETAMAKRDKDDIMRMGA